MTLKFDDFICKLTEKRGKFQELSPGERAAICTLVATGRSQRSVGKLFRVSEGAIRKTIKHWNTYYTFDTEKRSGRPEVLTKAEKRRSSRKENLVLNH
ncbi:hypothetical protein V8F06_001128 [Rhypophila decipiens]